MLVDHIKKVYLKASVATICTALFKRGLKNQFIQDLCPLLTQISQIWLDLLTQ